MAASNTPARPAPTPAPRPSRLWLIVVSVCALQIAAWVAWLIIASQHKVQEVPLATKGVGEPK